MRFVFSCVRGSSCHPSRSGLLSLVSGAVETFDDTGAPDDAPEPACTAHIDKLRELLLNTKLPAEDKPRVEAAIARHAQWIEEMDGIEGDGDAVVAALVEALNRYKRYIELDLIWDSPSDFLWRQRGQVKLDNSIMEEFLPRLVTPQIIPALDGVEYETGPRTAFAAAYFASTLANPAPGGGLLVRTKDQDFTVGRAAYLQSSFSEAFPPGDSVRHKIFLAAAAAECKTNLDKTMFQGGVSDAHDLKIAIPGARYYLLCEWLDMTPISTLGTDIDEVIILRGKRLASNIRSKYSTAAARADDRGWYENFLAEHPIREANILRLVQHLRALFVDADPDEVDVLQRGYF